MPVPDPPIPSHTAFLPSAFQAWVLPGRVSTLVTCVSAGCGGWQSPEQGPGGAGEGEGREGGWAVAALGAAGSGGSRQTQRGQMPPCNPLPAMGPGKISYLTEASASVPGPAKPPLHSSGQCQRRDSRLQSHLPHSGLKRALDSGIPRSQGGSHCRALGPSWLNTSLWPVQSVVAGRAQPALCTLPTACALFSLLQSEPRKCCPASLPNPPLYSLNPWEDASPMAYIHSPKPHLLRSI